ADADQVEVGEVQTGDRGTAGGREAGRGGDLDPVVLQHLNHGVRAGADVADAPVGAGVGKVSLRAVADAYVAMPVKSDRLAFEAGPPAGRAPLPVHVALPISADADQVEVGEVQTGDRGTAGGREAGRGGDLDPVVLQHLNHGVRAGADVADAPV